MPFENIMQQFQMESCQPITRLKDKMKKEEEEEENMTADMNKSLL